MGKKKETTEKNEQLDLIDVHPENAKEILRVAKTYKRLQKERLTISDKQVNAKQKILDLVKQAKLKRLEDGTIKFSLDSITISITPRDELVKVKDKDEAEAEAED